MKPILRPAALAAVGFSLLLTACDDDNAASTDAEPIRAGFVAALDQAAVMHNVTFTHGPATIAQEDDALVLTVPDTKITMEGGEPLNVTKLTFRFTKEDDAYRFEATDLPASITGTVANAADKAQLKVEGLAVTGNWLVAEKTYEKLLASWNKIDGTVQETGGPSYPLLLGKGEYSGVRTKANNNRVDETGEFKAETLTVGEPAATVTAPRFVATNKGVDLAKQAAFAAMLRDIQSGKAQPSQLPPFDFLAGTSFQYSDGGWRVAGEQSGQDAFRTSGTEVSGELKDLDKPAAVIDMTFDLKGIALPEVEAVMEAQTKPYIPKDIRLGVALENVKMADLMTKVAEALPKAQTADAQVQEAMIMLLGQSIIEDFSKSGGRIVIKDTKLLAEAAKLYLDGTLQPVDNSPFGLLASLKLDIVGLDKLIALAETDPSLQAFLDVPFLKALQAAGNKGDVKGEEGYQYQVELPADGNATINGKTIDQVMAQ